MPRMKRPCSPCIVARLMDRNTLGANGENAAAEFLATRGWTVVARNYRVREGEIDLIVRRDNVLAFVEVKTRSGRLFGTPGEAVTYRKRMRIRGLARRFLMETGTHAAILRFDVIEVAALEGGLSIRHIEAAF
jgi:putative endonuclease